MTNIYPSRKSLVLGAFIWGVMLFSLVATVYALAKDFDLTAALIIGIIWVPILFILGVVWFKTRYLIKDSLLKVKIGPYTEREIDIEDIWSITKSNNIIASPANSLKRIKIKYNGGMVLLSPQREREFIAVLKTLNPSIKTDEQTGT